MRSPGRASSTSVPAGSAPEVTLVLAPPDSDSVWKTVDRLAHTLAAQAGTTVRTVTEDGREVHVIAAQGQRCGTRGSTAAP